jgi:thioredoxin-like negative regulator of GroEL
MRRPLTLDDLDATYSPGRTPDRSRAVARQLEVWAEEDEPAGAEVTAADLLVAAGEQLLRVGDTAEAVRLFRLAVATGKPTTPDARCFLHNALLEAGDVDAARELAEQVRRERPVEADVYLFIGEDYEGHEDLREAHRWLTLGARRTMPDVEDDDLSFEAAHLLRSRRRVRQRLGMPPDDWDLLVPPVDLDALPD